MHTNILHKNNFNGILYFIFFNEWNIEVLYNTKDLRGTTPVAHSSNAYNIFRLLFKNGLLSDRFHHWVDKLQLILKLFIYLQNAIGKAIRFSRVEYVHYIHTKGFDKTHYIGTAYSCTRYWKDYIYNWTSKVYKTLYYCSHNARRYTLNYTI